MSDKLGIAHHVQHLIILAVDKCQLELVLSRVNAKDTWTTLAVQAVDVVSFDAGHVDRKIKRSNDAMITALITMHYSCRLKSSSHRGVGLCRQTENVQNNALLLGNLCQELTNHNDVCDYCN